MGKTRNFYLVKEHLDEEEFTVCDYPFNYDDDVLDDDIIEYDYHAQEEDSNFSITEITPVNVATPQPWDGIIRKEPRLTPKTYTTVPSLVTLCVDLLPISVRMQLPTYFPGVLDHIRE